MSQCIMCKKDLPDSELSDCCSFECWEKAHCHLIEEAYTEDPIDLIAVESHFAGRDPVFPA